MSRDSRTPFKYPRYIGLASATLILVIMSSSTLLVTTATAASGITVTVDAGTVVGKNNLSLGFMLDHEWKTWLNDATERELADDAGFRLVRILDWNSHSPKPCQYWYESTRTGKWDWTEVDNLIDKIFEIGAEPLICLGGTGFDDGGKPRIPNGMAVNPSTGLPYPESFAAYAKGWVSHFAQRGRAVRFYEIFNEPAHYFGYVVNTQKLLNYIAVWNAAARAMRQAKSGLMISQDHITMRKVLDLWLTKGDDVDYIDFHKYDSDKIGKYSDAEMFARAETWKIETGTQFYGPLEVQQRWQSVRGKLLPILITESNFNSYYATGTDPKIQQMAGTVWLSLVLRKSILSGFNYYVYNGFSSKPSQSRVGNGYGMVNSDTNKPWYPYYLQSLAGNNLAVGDSLVKSTSSSSEIAVLAWLHDQKLNMLLVCKAGSQRTVYLNGAGGQLKVSKLDDTISWTNARIQTSTIYPSAIYSTHSLTFNGYTVALLQMDSALLFDLTASTASSSQIDLAWTDNVADESDFHVERRTSTTSWAEIPGSPVNVTTMSDTGLEASTTYVYRVRAHRHSDGVYSDYSVEASALTQASEEQFPHAPSLISPSNGATLNSVVVFSWSSSAGATDYQIEINGSSRILETVSSTSHTAALGDGLSTWRVRAHNGSGWSGWTTTRSLTVAEPPTSSLLSIALAPSATTPPLGTVVSGALSPARTGAEISIQYRANGSQTWINLSEVKTDATSQYSYRWYPSKASIYELKASWAEDSEAVETAVTQLNCSLVSTSASLSVSSPLMSGTMVSVTGTLADQYGQLLGNEDVVLCYAQGGSTSWTTVVSHKTDSQGRYSLAWTPSTAGQYTLMVRWAGNATYGAAENTLGLNVASTGSVIWYIYLAAIIAVTATVSIILWKRHT